MAAAKTLHAGVLAQCDKLDGKADGIIDNPRQCKVDFKPLLCKGEATESCLTQHQVDIARKIYDGPRTAAGQQIVQSSAFPGSEISWVAFITPRWTIDYANDMMRYEFFSPPPGPDWKPDISKLADYAKQMGVAEALTSALNPDLRTFKANGGKLIAYRRPSPVSILDRTGSPHSPAPWPPIAPPKATDTTGAPWRHYCSTTRAYSMVTMRNARKGSRS